MVRACSGVTRVPQESRGVCVYTASKIPPPSPTPTAMVTSRHQAAWPGVVRQERHHDNPTSARELSSIGGYNRLWTQSTAAVPTQAPRLSKARQPSRSGKANDLGKPPEAE